MATPVEKAVERHNGTQLKPSHHGKVKRKIGLDLPIMVRMKLLAYPLSGAAA
ncbi:hypothetical protein [Bordetella petrii]|uniref:hypothetical protein n=1 Tax=Bordetella petrii TaxID=94624 RepID=UPI001A95B04D|nr:hypothetical protein [Bordetella petrii]MBO1112916.1 hypothetical protein [Bordetella petrii]